MLEITLLKIPQLLFVALCMIIVAPQMSYSTSGHDFCCILHPVCGIDLGQQDSGKSLVEIDHKPFCSRSLECSGSLWYIESKGRVNFEVRNIFVAPRRELIQDPSRLWAFVERSVEGGRIEKSRAVVYI
jgi:hypothetical protein